MSLSIRPVRVEELQLAVKALKVKKVPGKGQIKYGIIQILRKRALLLSTLIFNAIQRVQYFPKQWKRISLLPSLSKVFERLLTSQLIEFMDDNKTIPDHQFRFRSDHSAIEQLHRVVNHILKAFDHREYCNGVFLDIQQAFDRVWHLGLLAKVKLALPANHSSVKEREFVRYLSNGPKVRYKCANLYFALKQENNFPIKIKIKIRKK